jgi:threonine/homoserine/homoserine lactone efflux protein
MDIIITLSSIILVNLLAWITPGPNMLAVMNATINHGRRSGVLTGFGLALGATIWTILAVLGVTLLFD